MPRIPWAATKLASSPKNWRSELYGSTPAAIGQIIKLSGGLPFTIVGVFKESVDTFGQSEIQEDTMLIPYTVSRFFTPTAAVHEIYFSVATRAGRAARRPTAIKRVLQSRHRPESVYSVQNLNAVSDRGRKDCRRA